MKPEPARFLCATVLVACIFTLVGLAACRVECRPMFGIAIGVGTVAAIIGARQPA